MFLEAAVRCFLAAVNPARQRNDGVNTGHRGVAGAREVEKRDGEGGNLLFNCAPSVRVSERT